MAEKEVRKTTAKKTVRRSTTKVVSPKTTVRKTAPTAVRKAPARVALSPQKANRWSLKMLLAGFGFFVVLLSVSAAIGYTDKGQLNVESLISARKQNATPEEKVALEAVPTDQAKNNVPNGGLVGMGQPAPVVPPPVLTGTSTATSSVSSTASSTTVSATSTVP